MKKTQEKPAKETMDQKQLMGLEVECWLACVGLKVNFWCTGHFTDLHSSSCNLRTNER